MKNQLDHVWILNPTIVQVLTFFNCFNSTDSQVVTTVFSEESNDFERKRKGLDDEDYGSIDRNNERTFPESVDSE